MSRHRCGAAYGVLVPFSTYPFLSRSPSPCLNISCHATCGAQIPVNRSQAGHVVALPPMRKIGRSPNDSQPSSIRCLRHPANKRSQTQIIHLEISRPCSRCRILVVGSSWLCHRREHRLRAILHHVASYQQRHGPLDQNRTGLHVD